MTIVSAKNPGLQGSYGYKQSQTKRQTPAFGLYHRLVIDEKVLDVLLKKNKLPKKAIDKVLYGSDAKKVNMVAKKFDDIFGEYFKKEEKNKSFFNGVKTINQKYKHPYSKKLVGDSKYKDVLYFFEDPLFHESKNIYLNNAAKKFFDLPPVKVIGTVKNFITSSVKFVVNKGVNSLVKLAKRGVQKAKNNIDIVDTRELAMPSKRQEVKYTIDILTGNELKKYRGAGSYKNYNKAIQAQYIGSFNKGNLRFAAHEDNIKVKNNVIKQKLKDIGEPTKIEINTLEELKNTLQNISQT